MKNYVTKLITKLLKGYDINVNLLVKVLMVALYS
jgi:hypothetical protein